MTGIGGRVYLPDPMVFACVGDDGNVLRPTGLVHALPEPMPPIASHLDYTFQQPVCGAEKGEGCCTRLRHLASPSVIDDGYVIGTAVTCPDCLTIMAAQEAITEFPGAS